MTCQKCLQTRRRVINALPAKVAAPLAKAVMPTVTDAHALIAEARTWLGTPFLHQGRTHRGVDCVGFVIVSLQRLGCIPPDFEITDYPRTPTRDQLMQKIVSHCTRLPGPIPGSMLAIRWKQEVTHVGIFTGETLIHSYQKRGGVVEHSFRGRWLKLVDSAWALPGIRY